MDDEPLGRTTSPACKATIHVEGTPSPLKVARCQPDRNESSPGQPRISVIVPARNEAPTIERTLQRVFDDNPWEVIVVDGGSTDATADIARRTGAMVMQTRPGRGRQLHAGALAASGDILLFLHADTLLPRAYGNWAVRTLAAQETVAGAFKLYIDSPVRSMRLIERVVQIRSSVFQLPYGDQALFVRTEDYHRAGGYPDLPVMEDYCIVRRLRRLGRIRTLPCGVVTSGRRWERNGVWHTTVQNQLIVLAFRLGASPDHLATWRDGR